jgi:hypothetical protein
MKKNDCGWICYLAGLLFILFFAGSCKKDNTDKDKTTFEIGQNYGGGIIFYVDDSKQHGLICASNDQSASIPWWNGSNIVTNADGAEIGTGMANTLAIIAAQGDGDYAAKICNDLVLNGYSDWFLPSKSECATMYFNLKIFRSIGNFADELYWSSTEASTDNAYSQYSNDGYPPNGGYYKNASYHVRAVRAF